MRKLFLVVVLLIPVLQGCIAVLAGGAAGGALVADDRRSNAALLEDETIEFKASGRVTEKYNGLRDKLHLNVTSYNRNVLLTGEVPTEDVKTGTEQIAREVQNVRNVTNELKVGEATSFGSRSNDTLITSKVKSRFVSERKFQANWVKIVTENKVVYLMGIVNHKEAEAAADIAATTGGVEKVVKVFEYTD
ncbi:MAG: BON domain-containing protein [Burkholderiales bacterium]